jgi:hypothetical protein
MTEASVSFAGHLTDDPELRHTEATPQRHLHCLLPSHTRPYQNG